MSHPEWGYPTTGFNKKLIGETFDSNKTNRLLLEQAGMAKIADCVSAFGKNERVITYSSLGVRLNCSAESFHFLWAVNGDFEKFSKCLDYICVKGIILPKYDDNHDLTLLEKNYLEFVSAYCASHIVGSVVEDEKATLYIFKHEDDFDLYKSLNGCYDDGWIEPEATFLVKQYPNKTLLLTFYNPSEQIIKNKKIDIFINDVKVGSEAVKSGYFDIKIPDDLLSKSYIKNLGLYLILFRII